MESSRPVEIMFTQEEDLYLAENEMLNIQATGETIEGAFRDFVEQVVYFFRHYRGLSEREVMGEATRLRRLYLDEFSEIESP